jgi:tetratricopeptide (TPR) repeat protein
MSAASTLPPPPQGMKYCIACDELIPREASLCSHCHTSQVPEKLSWDKTGLKSIAAITAVIGLITGLSGLVGPLKGWWTVDRETKTMLAAAQRQAELGENSVAFDTYSEILKTKPNNQAALHGRVDVTLRLIEYFYVGSVRSNNRETDEGNQKKRALLDHISPVLEASLSSGKSYRDADVVAHLGWLNFLKMRVENEDGIVEENLRRALQMEPGNVFANAMLGEWLLDTNSKMDEARPYFATALKSGKERTFVRERELRSMIYDDNAGVRAELIRVANDMRKNGEPISDEDRSRIHSYFVPVVTDDAELREALTAVPPDEAMATYDWLAQSSSSSSNSDSTSYKSVEREFVLANLAEDTGKKNEALQQFKQLQQEINKLKMEGSVAERVNAAVKRLSRSIS